MVIQLSTGYNPKGDIHNPKEEIVGNHYPKEQQPLSQRLKCTTQKEKNHVLVDNLENNL